MHPISSHWWKASILFQISMSPPLQHHWFPLTHVHQYINTLLFFTYFSNYCPISKISYSKPLYSLFPLFPIFLELTQLSLYHQLSTKTVFIRVINDLQHWWILSILNSYVITIWPQNDTPRHISQKNDQYSITTTTTSSPPGKLYMNFYSSFTHNCQKLETQISFNGWMVKQTVAHWHRGILLSHKEELSTHNTNWMNL